MKRLNKRQREILEYLDEAYPYRMPKRDILSEFDDGNTRMELKILEKYELINVYRYSNIHTRRGIRYRLGDISLTITPKGKEKLRENFETRLVDAIYNNPLKAISIAIALISVVMGIITLWK
jgi:hypothetical protein